MKLNGLGRSNLEKKKLLAAGEHAWLYSDLRGSVKIVITDI